jgi:exodeoxyribonuclease VII small subunit
MNPAARSSSDQASEPTDGRQSPSSSTASSGEEIGYAAALAELDDILHELDGDEVDVDVLGARVRRAAELLRICRSRIASARFEVEQVVAELESDTEPSPEAP